MITSLSTWMRRKLDEQVPNDEILEDTDIDQILRNHRLTDPDRAWDMANSEDDRFDVDSSTGEVELRLRDIDGDKTEFSHPYTYYFFADEPAVTVDDKVVTSANWTWVAPSVDLIFAVARTETSPDVRIKGHIINWRAAMMEAGEMLLLKMARQPSIKAGEFDFLARRLRAELNSQYKPRIMRRH